MTFRCDGRGWDTTDLLEFKTSDPVVTIYADLARGVVFVGIRERDIGMIVHRADDSEIESVCRRYDLPQLLDYLRPAINNWVGNSIERHLKDNLVSGGLRYRGLD